MNLLKALSTVSAMTLLSRITGLARESLKAVAFGAGLQMDAFEAAFRLPNILRRLFAEGAFSQAFVPILAEYNRQRGTEATRDLVGRVGTLLAVLLVAISVLGMLAAPWLVYLLAGGFSRIPGKVELTADLIRIMFPYILFVSLVSLAGGVLNVYRRFAIPAFTPVLLNLAIIGAAHESAHHRACLGRRHRRRRTTRSAGSSADGAWHAATRSLRLARRRRAARATGDGSGGAWRVRRADLGAYQHATRCLSW